MTSSSDDAWQRMAGVGSATGRVGRAAAGLAVELRRTLRGRSVGYVGWQGHGNLGDDVIAELWSDGSSVSLASLGRGSAAARFRRLLPPRGVLVGGGTLVGHPGYLAMVRGARHLAVVAVGVEDPAFFGGHADDARVELRRWAAVLRGADLASVRGPLSQRLLSEVGLDLPIVPDVAVLAVEPAPAQAAASGVVGLNIGTSWAAWHDEHRFLDAVRDVGRAVAQRGWRVRLLVAWRGDEALVRQLAAQVPDADVVVTASADSFAAAVRDCDVVVAQKLHAIVLATGLGIPTVCLEYHPKCRDHMELLGRPELVVRTDEIVQDQLVEMIELVASERTAERQRLVSATADLRARAREGVADVTSWLREVA